MKDEATAYRKKLVEQIAETDDSLLEKYLDKGDLSREDLIAGLKHGTVGGGLLPVLCGSPVKNMGITAAPGHDTHVPSVTGGACRRRADKGHRPEDRQ